MSRIVIALALALALVAPTTAVAHASPSASGHPGLVSVGAKHKCTKTSTGKCIRVGQFCPNAKQGKRGWDSQGRVYICTTKHWRKP